MTENTMKPDPRNANRGTHRGRKAVRASLRDYGAGRSILVDKAGVIIAGNKTFEAATEAGIPVRVVQTDGKELVAVQRTDLSLEEPPARMLAIADNRASELGLEWDQDALANVLEELRPDTDIFSEDEMAELLGTGVSFDTPPVDDDPGDDGVTGQTHTCPSCGMVFTE